MKKITILFAVIACIAITSFLQRSIFAQSSSTARVRVGNPAILASSCPIPNGVVTCGSKFTAAQNGCGHCGAGYGASRWCTGPEAYEAINYSIDIGGAWGQETFLPMVKGNVVSWTRLSPITGTDQEIQRYAGTDTTTGEQYYIQFHHTIKGSAPEGTRLSGEHASNICNNCSGVSGPHVHIEFGSSGASGTQWLDAPLYFCQK